MLKLWYLYYIIIPSTALHILLMGESKSTVELNRALEIELLIDIFEMTLEINDNARRARRNLTLSLSTSWNNLLVRHVRSGHVRSVVRVVGLGEGTSNPMKGMHRP